MRRSGFTILELIVALAVSGIVLLGARQLLEGIADAADRLRVTARAADREANSESLLRSLVGRLEVGSDSGRLFDGDLDAARFQTWCDVAGGWQERCAADLTVDAVDGAPALVVHLSTGETIVLRRAVREASLRYLNDPAGRGQWFQVWTPQRTPPLAIGVIVDGDTTIVRIGERG